MKARKYVEIADEAAGEFMLQCDRACEGAEMASMLPKWIRFQMLQCDRACEGAEMSF